MSGGVKAGLLFGAIAIPITIGASFIPYLGLICCGPLGALLLGAAAGYLGVQWAGLDAGIGQGVLGGGLAGAGSLIGTVIFFVGVIVFLSNMPEFDQALQDALEQQSPGTGLTVEDIRDMLGLAGPIAGICVGGFGLLFGLGGGALGGWLKVRQRTQADPPAPPPVAPIPPIA
jgi:hypothetical protein